MLLIPSDPWPKESGGDASGGGGANAATTSPTGGMSKSAKKYIQTALGYCEAGIEGASMSGTSSEVCTCVNVCVCSYISAEGERGRADEVLIVLSHLLAPPVPMRDLF